MSSAGTGFVVLAGIMAVMFAVMMTVMIVGYVLGSVGRYSIIKRRGLKYPGFAWVPVLAEYSMGKISDDARIKAGAKKSFLRKWILVLSIVVWIITILICIGVVILETSATFGTSSDGPTSAWVIILYCLIWMVYTAYYVLNYIAMFNIFRSCSDAYVVFTVLSIVFNVTGPLFIFAVRKKDRDFRI